VPSGAVSGAASVGAILIEYRASSSTERDKETIEADLVVDTSGRGSSSPTWLNTFGFAKPPEEQITVNLGYVTRF
jgi:hypothetical protein